MFSISEETLCTSTSMALEKSKGSLAYFHIYHQKSIFIILCTFICIFKISLKKHTVVNSKEQQLF